MASPKDVAMAQVEDFQTGDPQAHQPFTTEENIDQLNTIGRSIAELMDHTATALNALTIPSTSERTSNGTTHPALDAESQKEVFHSATDSFLATLHSIDVRMKRQVMALEEAGIVELSNVPRQGPGNDKSKASLKPNGVGTVGNLDVGWLNSRSWRVERDMEAELWQEARQLLERHGGENVTN